MRSVVALAAVGVLLAGGRLKAQAPLRAVADSVVAAWAAHDAEGIVAGAGSVLLNLPGAQPAAAVGRAQAAALIHEYLAGSIDETLVLQAVRSTGRDRGFAELARRFRPTTESPVRTETVLLGFRRAAAGWRLDELRVVR